MPDPVSDLGTHEVINQPMGTTPYDPWHGDPVLRAHAAANGADQQQLAALSQRLATEDAISHGQQARRCPPEAVLFDRAGRRLDEVSFHPSYHRLLEIGLSSGYASGPWVGGSHVTHAATVYLVTGVEPGVCCPMTMTYAGIPALGIDPRLAATWVPKLTRADYDPAVAPISAKRAATLGMAMTEKQGGSDVRANSTVAEADGRDWRLTGHKWFCSAPMSDGFLTLAQAPGGLTCFLVPRWLADGTRNGIRLMRLKDKLGNHANASAEIEYHRAFAHQLGEAGQGVRTIIEMVHHTRLDTAMAPAGLMRAALAEAAWWCRGRTVFQRRLIDQPLMRTVLADLVLDWEGATALGLRVARAFDDPDQRPFARVAVALAKYLSNKRAPTVIAEAMEALGGIGYVDETPMPMLYREAPLNGIWEGSGNVICLDILRTLAKEPEAAAALADELDAGRGEPAYAQALDAFRQQWPGLPPEEEARAYVERAATLLTASVLLRTSPVGPAYAATRLGERGLTPGAVTGFDPGPILDRLGQPATDAS